jgi:aminoglycoside phosphotransferase (APT) family kinase protein
MTAPAEITGPPAEGRRLPWTEVERQLGGRVLEAVTQRGGFSPGVAARLRLSGGGRAFVKAVGDVNPDSPGIHRAEARIAAALPASAPAPRLLGYVDHDGWVILILEDIEGRMPAQPWQEAELDRVLAAMTDLAAALCPAPVEVPPAAAIVDDLGSAWQECAAAPPRTPESTRLAALVPWAARNLDNSAALERNWADAVRGDCLVHGDIRADNILLTADRVMFVDWPWACTGPPWLDLVAMLPSVAMQGGPPPETILARHPLGQAADPDAVTVVVAALAGFFLWKGVQPDPPGLPTLRAFQRAQGMVALDWLRQRTGWA